MTGEAFRKLALSFPETEENPHFDRRGFKVTGRKMFASYLEQKNSANIFLSPREQNVFCEMDRNRIYPVPNKWGEKGATTFELDSADPAIIQEALYSAYQAVLNK